MNKRWLAAPILPIFFGLVVREIVVWRPQRIAVIGNGPLRVSVSPDGKWLLAEEYDHQIGVVEGAHLIELPTGKRREFPPRMRLHTVWTSASLLAPRLSNGDKQSAIEFVAPDTLKPRVFSFGGVEEPLSWAETKTDVWVLTRRQCLHFDAHSHKLLGRKRFSGAPERGRKRVYVDLSPDGQLARVENKMWDLRRDQPLEAPAFEGQDFEREFHWVNNRCFFYGGELKGINSNLNRVWTIRPMSELPGFRMDKAKNRFFCVSTKRYFFSNAATLSPIESKRGSKFPLNGLSFDFSPDRTSAYTSRGGEIWRVPMR